MSHDVRRDIIASLAVTALGAMLAWFLVGGIPAIGIDDAAITRSYAENLARGAGYVYNVGGERVEGSTALLWMLILTVAYLITPTPEVLIIALCGLITVGAVLAAFRVTRCLAERLDAPADLALLFLATILLASPGYFLWTVWTMMELALWSGAVLWLVAHLVDWTESEASYPEGRDLGLFLPALMLPLIRPEGSAVALGLIALGTLLAPVYWRRGVIAMTLVLAVFAAVTLFRLSYFGQPFPNTFYAKVSSDTLQGLVDGLKYAVSFVLGAPFAELHVVVWAAAATWAAFRLRPARPGSRGLLVVAAAIFGFLVLYAALGGDHFVLWRFYQPIAPLLPVALAVGAALAVPRLTGDGRWRGAGAALPAAALAMLAGGWMHFYQARFDVVKEFMLVQDGLGFGRYLNDVEPRPSIGVGPAGGIALAYDGYIYDLLGLNWTEMAQANPVKVGMRNHASFDKATFWKHPPEVVATFNVPCGEEGGRAPWSQDPAQSNSFDGLFHEPRFRETYLPVLFHDGDLCWPGFASPQWLERLPEDGAGVEALNWSDIQRPT